MAEKLNNTFEQITISDLYEQAEKDGMLTTDDYKNAEVNLEEEGGYVVLPNDIVVQSRVNLSSILGAENSKRNENEVRPVTRIDISNRGNEDGEIRLRNSDGVEIVIEHDNSEMYRSHKRSSNVYRSSYYKEDTSLLESISQKERHYLIKTALVENAKGERFKRGFTSSEAVIQRFKDEKGNWPTEKNMRKYIALTRVNFTYELKNGAGHGSAYFEPGDTFLAPKKFEDVERKLVMDKKTDV